jgi:hypothetical protein
MRHISRYAQCHDLFIAVLNFVQCRGAVVTSTKEHNVIVMGAFTNKILPMQTLLYTSKIS